MNTNEIGEEKINQLSDEFFLYIIEKIYSKPELFKEESSDLIFQYTNMSALIGMVENQCIWATHLYFLNDRNEYKHGISLINEIIETITTQENKYIFQAISKVIEDISTVERYVACFSKKADSLSQWRAYGNNGTGVSIGFVRKKLKTILQGEHSFKSIVYDKEMQKTALKLIIEEATKFFVSKKEEFDWHNNTYYWVVGYSISKVLDFIIANYKDPAFEEEKEYRIECKQFHNRLNAEAKQLKIYHRTNEKLIIPYTKIYTKPLEDPYAGPETDLFFKVEQLPIKKIIIGPSSNQDDVINGIKKLLQNNFYTVGSCEYDVEIIKSQIPYRL